MKFPAILFRQGVSYGLVGVVVLLVDWGTFVSASGMGVATVPANLTGRVVGACLGFWLNGIHTFRDVDGARLGWRRIARYVGTWCVLSALSSVAVLLVDQNISLAAAWLAKPAVDGLLAAVAFVVSRQWIYS